MSSAATDSVSMDSIDSVSMDNGTPEIAESDDARRPPTTGVSWGWVAVALGVVQGLTGLVLMFHYTPTFPEAHLDLVDLREVSPFGWLRGLHRWGSHTLLVLAGLHLVRVALRGADTRPRRQAWPGGVVLTMAIVLLALTGSVLALDEGGRWGLATLDTAAVDPERGDARLLRFYLVHCVVLPLFAAGLIVDHLRRARRG